MKSEVVNFSKIAGVNLSLSHNKELDHIVVDAIVFIGFGS